MAFTGQPQGNQQVLLQWQIEYAQAGTMQLEYSTTDTTAFTAIINTQAVDSTVSSYSYLQVPAATGANYYRIRLINADDSVTYSPVVTIIETPGVVVSVFSVYPNPAVNTVVVTLPQVGTAEINVYNSVGELVQRLVTGAAVNTIDIHSLAAGMYTVKVVQSGITATGSFIKVH